MSTRKKKNEAENESEGYEFDYENMPVGREAADDEEDGEDEIAKDVDTE